MLEFIYKFVIAFLIIAMIVITNIQAFKIERLEQIEQARIEGLNLKEKDKNKLEIIKERNYQLYHAISSKENHKTEE